MNVKIGTIALVFTSTTALAADVGYPAPQAVPSPQQFNWTGLYIGARLGPGPRDGLMTGLHRRTGWKIWIVRTGIEVVVLVVGVLLGGQFGIGTVAFALLIGPMVNLTLPLFHISLVEPVETPGPSQPTPTT